MALREQRKRETRLTIAAAAMVLFAAEGFDKVSISQIADAAGVSKMTVTNYFARKEDLVFDRAEANIRSLADAADRRLPGESLLGALRRDYTERLAAGDVALGPPTAEFARLIRGSHALTARGREITELRERALADAIAGDRIVAAQLASIHRVLFEYSADRVIAGDTPEEIRRSLATEAQRAFDLLEPSLAGYGVRP